MSIYNQIILANSYYNDALVHIKKHLEAKSKNHPTISDIHAKKALKLLEDAANYGSTLALFELALYYAANSFGTKELYLNSIENAQTKLSLQYLQSAASRKNKEAMFELGRYYYVNLSTITKKPRKTNPSLAFQWFKNAHNAGHLYAWEYMAEIYLKQKDSSKAFYSLLSSHIPTDKNKLKTWKFADALYNLFEEYEEENKRLEFFEPFIKAENRNIMFLLMRVGEITPNYSLIKNWTIADDKTDHFKYKEECRDIFTNLSKDIIYKEKYYSNEEVFRWFESNKDYDLWALHHYAMCYYEGYYVKQDYSKAISLLKQAALKDSTIPLYPKTFITLGDCYFYGYGVIRSYTKAREYYEKTKYLNLKNDGTKQVLSSCDRTVQLAYCYKFENKFEIALSLFELGTKYYDAKQIAWALTNLGAMYYNGQGTSIDYVKAFKYFKQAADTNYSYAINYVGLCYYNGQGIEKDYKEAYKYFCKADELGYIAAPFNIGLCYQAGNGVEKDLQKAIVYYKKALKNGYMPEKVSKIIKDIEDYLSKQVKANASVTKEKPVKQNTELEVKEVKKTNEESARQKLDKLIGLQSVKEEITYLENIILTNKKKKALGLPTIDVSKHMVFTGNPGTGKTTVARIVAQIFKENGLLKKGQLIETDRGGLVDQYIGGTAQKTKKKIEEALGGVLFIDEAYALIPENSEKDFGHEAVATLLKYMEDHKDDFVVIVAGYEKEMRRFIESNSGLKSRFTTYINFPDYSPDELQQIFESIIKKDQYVLTLKAKEKLMALWNESLKYSNLGNGRAVRNVYEKIQRLQATRIIKNNLESKADLTTITIDDIPSANEAFK